MLPLETIYLSPAASVGNESVPIQLSQCWFPGLAISSAKLLLWFETSKMLIAVLKNKFIVSFFIIFGALSFPIGL